MWPLSQGRSSPLRKPQQWSVGTSAEHPLELDLLKRPMLQGFLLDNCAHNHKRYNQLPFWALWCHVDLVALRWLLLRRRRFLR